MKAPTTYIAYLSKGVPVGAQIEGAAVLQSAVPNRRAEAVDIGNPGVISSGPPSHDGVEGRLKPKPIGFLAGTLELRYAQGPNPGLLVGYCREAPLDHVFSFDRISRMGRRMPDAPLDNPAPPSYLPPTRL